MVETEICRAVRDERVELDERVGVEKQLQAFARSQLAALVLLLDPLLAAAEQLARASLRGARARILLGHGLEASEIDLNTLDGGYRSNAAYPQIR